MKKTMISTLILLLLAFALVGCSDTDQNEQSTTQEEPAPVEAQREDEETGEEEEVDEGAEAVEIRTLFASLDQEAEYALSDIEELFDGEGVYRPDRTGKSSFRTYDITMEWGRVSISVRISDDIVADVRLEPRSATWFANTSLDFPSNFRQIFDDTSAADMTREWATELLGGEPYYSVWRRDSGFDEDSLVWSDGNWWFRIGGTTVQAGQG